MKLISLRRKISLSKPSAEKTNAHFLAAATYYRRECELDFGSAVLVLAFANLRWYASVKLSTNFSYLQFYKKVCVKFELGKSSHTRRLREAKRSRTTSRPAGAASSSV